MASNGSGRSGLLSAGGILSIVAGVFQIIGGVLMAVLLDLGVWFFWWPLQSGLEVWGEHIGDLARVPYPPPAPIWPLIIIGFVLVALGIVAVVGGVWAIRRKSFGLSLAGAICALPSVILGIPAVIFVSLGKREFEAQR
jgi:hypothetical protein